MTRGVFNLKIQFECAEYLPLFRVTSQNLDDEYSALTHPKISFYTLYIVNQHQHRYSLLNNNSLPINTYI